MEKKGFIADRFLGAIVEDAEKLQEKEGDEINPTGQKKWNGGNDHCFKDNCVYVYSLSSLHSVLKGFASFDEVISSRREQEEDKTENQWRRDLKRLVDLPSDVAFDLRGYVGAFSEENMVLEADKLRDLRDILKRWSSSTMSNGEVQDKLYQFLWNYASTQFKDDSDEKDDCIKIRVNREIKAFKDVLGVSFTIVWDMFNSVWDGYKDMVDFEQEEKNYIDRVIDEKLQPMRQELQKIGLLVSSMQGAGQTQGELNSRVGSCIKDLYERINGIQGQPVQQQNSNGWYKCPVIKSFNRPCKGKVKHGEYCEECSTYFP